MLHHALLASFLLPPTGKPKPPSSPYFHPTPPHVNPHHVSSSPSLSGQPPLIPSNDLYSLTFPYIFFPYLPHFRLLIKPQHFTVNLSHPTPVHLHIKSMRTSLFRTGSGPLQKPVLPGFPNPSLSSHASLPGHRIPRLSSSISLNFRSPDHIDTPPRTIKRVSSESDAIRSATESFGVSRKMKQTETLSFPATVSGEEFLSQSEWYDIGFGGGLGSGRDDRITTVTGGNDGDRVKIGAYYEEMLRSNPTDALLLGNYGKFLYEVEKDAVRAEEYYGRAILANPGDGELLSLYGKLIWETQRDEGRAKSYFEHAVQASPNDCSILGSYAHFMWEAEEEEEEEEEEDGANRIAREVTAAC